MGLHLTDSQLTGPDLSLSATTEYDFGLPSLSGSPRAAQAGTLPSSLRRYRILKRGLDCGLIALSLPLLLPVVVTLAVIVKMTSPGPVFFSHRRIARNASFFSMWKFRTMRVDAAAVLELHLAAHPEARAEWNQRHKLTVDPRVTSVGLFLRRFSLDELPQVWNVLTGQMSLVGPRPIVAAEVEKFGDCFECYCRVKPGITGLWQVSGRSKLTYEERVRLECEYVKRWSVMGDVKILTLTFRSVVNHDGAF